MGLMYLMVVVLLAASGYSYFDNNERRLHVINFCAAVLTAGCSLIIAYLVSANNVVLGEYVYIDAISAVLLLAIGILALSGVTVSVEYLRRENLPVRKKGQYYFLLQLFILSMILVVILDNAGLTWVAIEATTIVSALLVVFHLSRQSLEAAWKYVIICSIGICFALLGTILLYYAQVNAVGAETATLNWQSLRVAAPIFEPKLAVLAFLFILIGYGTKAGLAPMHTWLPDAHSQAPAPISALLSGGLIATAVYALVRNVIIFKLVLQPAIWQGLLVFFSLLSIVIVIPFMYKQNDLKRLLAYSSIEHIGIITLGLVGDCYLAAYGMIFHILNHAINKSVLFYLTGEIILVFKTKHVSRITQLFSKTPKLGWLLFLGMASIVGLPPFSVFFSKLYILFGLMAGGRYVVAVVALLAIAVIFMLMLKTVMQMCCGGIGGEKMHSRPSPVVIAVATLMLLILLIMGLILPNPLQQLLHNAAIIIAG
ncbi:MAG: proton-conducting transporter membrane subunit [Bacillota bacterium]